MLNVEGYINTDCWNNGLKKAVCDIQKDIHLNASPSHTGLRRLCRLSPSHLASADTRALVLTHPSAGLSSTSAVGLSPTS